MDGIENEKLAGIQRHHGDLTSLLTKIRENTQGDSNVIS
jgi:hypothetical protein